MAAVTSPSLQNMITSVRRLLNQPSPDNSFWSDSELTEYLQEAVRVYFAELTNLDEGHFGKVADLDIAQNAETVSLPSDFFEIRALYKKTSGGTQYVMLPYRNNISEGYNTQGGTNSEQYFPYYYFRGNQIVLRPTPNFAEVGGLKLEYIGTPDVPSSGADTLTAQISPVFKQVVEMYAVHKAKLKESLVNGVRVHDVAREHLGELSRQFRDVVALRSKGPTFIKPFNPES